MENEEPVYWTTKGSKNCGLSYICYTTGRKAYGIPNVSLLPDRTGLRGARLGLLSCTCWTSAESGSDKSAIACLKTLLVRMSALLPPIPLQTAYLFPSRRLLSYRICFLSLWLMAEPAALGATAFLGKKHGPSQNMLIESRQKPSDVHIYIIPLAVSSLSNFLQCSSFRLCLQFSGKPIIPEC